MPLWIRFDQEKDSLQVRWVAKGQYERLETEGAIQYHYDAGDQCIAMRVSFFVHRMEDWALADLETRDCPYEGVITLVADTLRRAKELQGAYPTTMEMRLD